MGKNNVRTCRMGKVPKFLWYTYFFCKFLFLPQWGKGITIYDKLQRYAVMGFNYAACGERSVESFVNAMCESGLKQLILSARFIKQAGMLPALQNKNWAEFARRYNGPAYAQNRYDEKLAEAYRLFGRMTPKL